VKVWIYRGDVLPELPQRREAATTEEEPAPPAAREA
jgi:hypothetical protein